MATYGIDLGTTNSCIAYVDDSGRPVILKSAVGEDTTPSVVYFESPENVVVGRQAKDAAMLVPELVVELIKQRMGEDVHYRFHGQDYTPESISALILRELARAAEEQTGEEVRDVVITVPAHFGLLEREATREAGRIAGLNVLSVLADPVAAALQYQVLANDADVRNILVYDLGGATFDTTVIRIEGDDVHVICTDGDQRLGGADWDREISDFLLLGITERYPQLDPGGDEHFMQDLALFAEQLKKSLSAVMSRPHILRFEGAVVRLELTREHFEEITADLLERTMDIAERTIAAAREKGVDHFDDVLLVGGMTFMPAVARTLRERFGLEARLHDPQLAVAKGAALFALMGQVRASLPDDGDPGMTQRVADQLSLSVDQVKALMAKRVEPVVPRAFGLKVVDTADPMFKIDPSRARSIITPLPTDAEPMIFQTVFDGQRAVELEIWEQAGQIPSEELEHNTHIGYAVLRDLPPRPAGTRFEVAAHMTESGLLQIRGREAGSGREVAFEIQTSDRSETRLRETARAVARYEGAGGAGRGHESAERDPSGPDLSDMTRGELHEVPELGFPVEPDPMQHYLVAEVPTRISAITDFSLLVRIAVNLPRQPRLSAPIKGFVPEPSGTAVTIIVQVPAQLRPIEALEQVLIVPPQGDSEPARFAFRAERPGLFKVRISAFIGGTFLGELAAEISVEAHAQRTERRTLVSDPVNLRREPGEATLQVRFDGDRYTFQLLSDSYLFGPVPGGELTAQPSGAIERTIAILRAMADMTSGYSANNARRWMREAGIGLWNEMVPDLIKEQFWQLRSSITAFSIVCGKDAIPWELLYPLSTFGEDAGFLVDQFPVLRRVYDQRRSRHLALGPASYVVPPRSPGNALAEITALQRKLGAKSGAIADLETLLTLIDSGDFGVLHFACHNTFKSDAGGSLVAMDGGPFVPALLNGAVTTRALAARTPLVFINACRSAGAVPEYTQLLGWAGQFMAAGAGAFIGTLWAVPSDSAQVFAEAFYDCLKASRTLGAAVQEARRAVSRDTADPTWLAYSVYGDPAATVTAT